MAHKHGKKNIANLLIIASKNLNCFFFVAKQLAIYKHDRGVVPYATKKELPLLIFHNKFTF